MKKCLSVLLAAFMTLLCCSFLLYTSQNSINTPVSEVISTYVYKIGVLQFSYSYSTAVE